MRASTSPPTLYPVEDRPKDEHGGEVRAEPLDVASQDAVREGGGEVDQVGTRKDEKVERAEEAALEAEQGQRRRRHDLWP